LAQTMTDLDFKSCLADADVWMRPAVNPCGFRYMSSDDYVKSAVTNVEMNSLRLK
jgi:hypothetical protein